MSNSNDFDKTKPNIPGAYDADAPNDWEKTNNKFSPQPNADDWSKTAPNYAMSQDDEPDFDKTYNPSAQNPKTPDWGMSQSDIKFPQDDDRQEDYGGGRRGDNYAVTTPLIRLPEAERAKYQNIPPTPTEEKAKQKEEEQKKGGIPTWLLVTGGMAALFFFAVITMLAIWYFFLYKTGFNVTLTSVPQGSRVLVDTVDWGVTTDGSQTIILTNLKAGENKEIQIKNQNFECQKIERVIGKDGEDQSFRANCTEKKAVVVQTDDCKNFKKGEEARSQKCAEDALRNLKEPFSADDLARILSMYIINFARSKYDIPEKNMLFLEKASVYMKKLPSSTIIEIGGHTDSDGTDESNMTLSNNRAKSVRDALVNKFGVTASMLTQKGYGETKPKDGNQNRNDDEKFQNRRIEYTVLSK